jgi:hypothetical protein
MTADDGGCTELVVEAAGAGLRPAPAEIAGVDGYAAKTAMRKLGEAVSIAKLA